MVRAFLAIDIDESTRGELVSAQSALPKAGIRLKLVEPQNLHLTLKFLGEVSEDKIAEISETLTNTTTGFQEFEMQVKGLGAFPSLHRPRILWAGIAEGRERVVELQRRLDASLQPVGFPPERDFHPHITLARVKFVRGGELASFIRGASTKEFGTTRVGEVTLVQSTLTPKGPIYTKLVGVKLEPQL
jgi:2'-5' RNA ligase